MKARVTWMVWLTVWLLEVPAGRAELLAPRGAVDGRVRVAAWREEEVFELRGRVGYQIDLEFEPGEAFVGIAAGDIEALSFVAEANHLFLKPRAAPVRTNLTVLTTRRQYQFEYLAGSDTAASAGDEVMFALRFTYPVRADTADRVGNASRIESQLNAASARQASNIDYWYCGSPAIKPIAASDDGLHTRLRFASRAELPVLFVRNDDGSESLLNFSLDDGDVIVHRVARAFVLRRGRLTGCLVNKGFQGASERPASGTVSPQIERHTEGGRP